MSNIVDSSGRDTGYSTGQLQQRAEVRLAELDNLARNFKRHEGRVPLSVRIAEIKELRALAGLPRTSHPSADKSHYAERLGGIEYRAYV